jgi:hypothetical protein
MALHSQRNFAKKIHQLKFPFLAKVVSATFVASISE